MAAEWRLQPKTNCILNTLCIEEIVGQSPQMQKVYQQIEWAAASDIPVLITGETGTGKDLVAQAIHRCSKRRENPFIPVNMGAIPSELVGSELFGHEKGAFTGAVERYEGKFEQGNGGTVFLDEVGSIDEKVQVSLLRLLEEKSLFRLGGSKHFDIDVRLVAATNANLTEKMQKGLFRQDLYYRLDVFCIHLPPLRERLGDLKLLIESFALRYYCQFQKKILKIAPACYSVLEAYQWPGNIRELKNVIQRAVLVCDESILTLEHLPPRFRENSGVEPTITFEVGTPLGEMERQMILRVLAMTDNNRTRAAEVLGISRRVLYNKLSKHKIGFTAKHPKNTPKKPS